MIVRELFAKLGLSVDAASFAVADQMLGAVKSGLGLLVSGAVRAGEGLTEIIAKTVETASALNDTSVALGVTTDAIQELGYAAQLNGSSVEGMSDGIRKLSINMQAAASGSEEAAQTFRRLGVQITEGGKLRAADAVLADIADKFKAMPSGARRVAAAVDLFGKSGAALIPTLAVGSAKLAELRQEARDLGIVLDKDTIAAGDDLGDSWDKLKAAADGLRYSIGGPLLEGIRESVDATVAWVKANRALLAQRLQGLLKGLVSGLKLLASGLLLVWRGLNFVIARWKLFAVLILSTLAAIVLGNGAAVLSFLALGAAAIKAAVSAAAAWIAAEAPFFALVALIAVVLLALEDLWVFLNGGKSLIGDVGKELARLVSDFIDQGPKDGEHWMIKILRATLIYLKLVGEGWAYIFKQIFAGVSWMATKIDGLIGRLMKVLSLVNQQWDVTGAFKRSGQGMLESLNSAGASVGGVLERHTQGLFAPKTPMMSSSSPATQSKVINASYAPTIVQQPGQSATAVAEESQRLWSEWMSGEVETASASVGVK